MWLKDNESNFVYGNYYKKRTKFEAARLVSVLKSNLKAESYQIKRKNVILVSFLNIRWSENKIIPYLYIRVVRFAKKILIFENLLYRNNIIGVVVFYYKFVWHLIEIKVPSQCSQIFKLIISMKLVDQF